MSVTLEMPIMTFEENKLNGLETTNIFFCPKCGSQNVAAIFFISGGKLTPTTPSKDRCLHCGYEELRGLFKIINQLEVRDKKIEDILDGIS